MNKIIEWIMTHKWAITPEALYAIIDIANKSDVKIDPSIFHRDDTTVLDEGEKQKSALLPGKGRRLEEDFRVQVSDTVGVINVFGPIFPRANLFTMSGGTSISSLSNSLQTALNSKEINSIVLNIDSPGGEVTDVEAFGEMIFKAREQKPIIAFVTGMAASAGFWIASSASEIVSSRTGEVGSIGILAAIRDTSEKDAKAGIKNINIISSISPKKRQDLTTVEGQADTKSIVDEIGMMFVDTVARNRGTDANDVIANFGQGAMILSTKAIELGMIDRIDSLENVVTNLNNKNINSNGGIFMPKETKEIETKKTDISIEDINKIKDDSFQAGVTHENKRIQDIESLEDSENKKVISEHKFDINMSKEDVALVIIENQKQKSATAAKAHKEDAENLAGEKIKSEEISNDDEDRKSASDMMVHEMNRKRGLNS